MQSTWYQCLCPFQFSVTRHIFTKICFTANLYEGPVRRDPSATPFRKRKIVLFKVYLLVLTISDHNNNHDEIFHCVAIRQMQLLSYFAYCSSMFAFPLCTLRGSCSIARL